MSKPEITRERRAFVERSQGFRQKVADLSRREPVLPHRPSPNARKMASFRSPPLAERMFSSPCSNAALSSGVERATSWASAAMVQPSLTGQTGSRQNSKRISKGDVLAVSQEYGRFLSIHPTESMGYCRRYVCPLDSGVQNIFV